jgi:hypothetical protein
MLDVILQILGGALLGGAAAAAITLTVSYFIDKRAIKKEAQRKFKEAFRAEILEKSKHAVNVGIFDHNDDKLGELEITSEKGVDQSLYEHQIIYLYD